MRPIMIVSFIFLGILLYLNATGKIPMYVVTIFGLYGGIITTFEEDYRKKIKRKD